MAGPPGSERPAAQLEPWPQEKLLRHAGIGYEIVQSLDVTVPQIGEQLPNIVQFFAAQLPVVAEPVLEVPKILQDRTPQRLGDCLRQPQMADQLVDVPTVVSYSSLQQLVAEQIVDIPAPGRAGGRVEVFKVYSQDRIQLRLTSSKPLTFQFRVVEVFKALAQDRVQQLLHLRLVLQMTLGRVFFFALSLGEKKVRPHSGSELSAGFNPSTLSAHQMPGSHLRAPEQLVDVPVPQILERPRRRKLLEVLSRLSRSLEEEEEVAEDEEEEEEEEEEEGSRFLPHFRPCRWCWYVHAGSICLRGWQSPFAHHESETPSRLMVGREVASWLGAPL